MLGRHCVSDHLGLASTGVTFSPFKGGGDGNRGKKFILTIRVILVHNFVVLDLESDDSLPPLPNENLKNDRILWFIVSLDLSLSPFYNSLD